MAREYTHVRVPVAIATEIERLQNEMLLAYELGQTNRVELTEQGKKGEWIAKHEVIRILIADYDDHKKRSKRSKKRNVTIESK
jgi:hypothetical protein